MLNNRELASAILLGSGLIAACFSGSLRSNLICLVRAAFGWKLSTLWVTYIGLVVATTYGLHRVGLGYPDSAKDAVVWGLIAGLPILFKFGDDRCVRNAYIDAEGPPAPKSERASDLH